MSSAVRDSISAEAGRYGFSLSIVDRGSAIKIGIPASAWKIQCSKCNRTFKKAWGPKCSPELMIKNMRRLNWTVRSGHPPLCETCSNSPRQIFEGEKRKAMAELKNGTALPVPAALKAEEEPKLLVTSRIARAVCSFLEENFLTAQGAYGLGWSDARVAKEAGTSEAVVIKLRREAFGELAEDPALTALRRDMIKLGTDFTEWVESFRKDVAGLRSRIDSFKAR